MRCIILAVSLSNDCDCLNPFDNLPQVHAYIISSLRKDMPSVFGKEAKKKELIANLKDTYLKIEKEYQISPGDFPKLEKMQVRWEATSHRLHTDMHTPQVLPRKIQVNVHR